MIETPGGGAGVVTSTRKSLPACYTHACMSDDECLCANTKCVQFKCKCKTGYSEQRGRCVPNNNGTLGKRCRRNSQCSDREECHSGRCLCKTIYDQEDNQCISILGKKCDTDLDCDGAHIECFRNHCLCDDGYEEENDIC